MASENRCPDVIRFGYEEFKTDEAKKTVTAKCKTCRVIIHEKLGTSSAFKSTKLELSQREKNG